MSDFKAFVDDYYRSFVHTLETFDRAPMQDVLRTLETVQAAGGTVWTAGNGGSAAIADHTVCDATKGTHVPGKPPLRTVSLVSNTAMLTALSNDISYEAAIRQQLEFYLRPGDAVLLVSSSGNSPNIVEACRYAKSEGATTIAFVGFEGGELRRMADHVVWIPIDNYGIAEDIHQSLIHVITQYLRARADHPTTP